MTMSRRLRLLRLLAGAVAIAALVAVALAFPANAEGKHKGHLVLTVDGVATQLPPGQAVKDATTTCANRGTPVAAPLAVDAVRASFPVPLLACPGVTLASQVPAT